MHENLSYYQLWQIEHYGNALPEKTDNAGIETDWAQQQEKVRECMMQEDKTF